MGAFLKTQSRPNLESPKSEDNDIAISAFIDRRKYI